MMRFKVNSTGLFILMVSLIGLLLLSGCGQSGGGSGSGSSTSGENTSSTTQNEGDPYGFYNQVQMGQTKEQVDAALGVTPEELATDSYIYTDKDGYAVAVGFSDILSKSGAPEVLSKMIYGTKSAWYMNSVGKKNEITDEQAAKITEGMSYDQVKTILGSDGIENTTMSNYDGTVNITRIWLKDGVISGLALIFKGADGGGTVVQIITV